MEKGEYYEGYKVPESKKVTCKICYLSENTGSYYSRDMDSGVHEGFTVGNGKSLYWEIIWHQSGHCTVYSRESGSPRWINGDQLITIHFK